MDKPSAAHIALLSLSLGAIVAWQLFLFCNVTPYIGALEGPEASLDRAYCAQSIALVAAYLLASWKSERVESLLKRKALPGIAAVGAAASTAILSFAGASAASAIVLFPLGGALAALSSAALLLTLTTRFCSLTLQSNLVASACSFGLASILFLAASPLLREAALAFAVLLAVASGACLSICDRLPQPSDEPQIARVPSSEERLAKRHSFVRFALLLCVWAALIEFLRMLYLQAGMNAAGNALFTKTQAVGAAVVILIVAAIVLCVRLLPKLFKLSWAYRAILLLSVISLMALPLVFLGAPFALPYALTTGSSMLLSLTIWVLSVAFANRGDAGPVKTVGRVRSWLALSTFAGFFAARAAFPLIADSLANVLTINLVAVCLLLLGYLSLFTETDVNALSSLFPTKRKERFMALCADVAQRYNLSDRELDVMKLLAKGWNAAHIQETLFISYNTVATHRKHIYQKLDIHSQQELLSLLDTHAAAGNRAERGK